MATLNLAAFKPSSGQLVSASPISNAFTAIEAAVNSIDNTQFAAGRIFDPTKLIEASSVQRIADSTAGGAVANIDFTSISANFAHLLVVLYARSDRAASVQDTVGLRFNNDSGSNYDNQTLQTQSTTVTGAGTASGATTSGSSGAIPASTAPASSFGGGMILIPQYGGSIGHQPYIIFSEGRMGSAALTDHVLNLTAGTWFATPAAVNRLTLICQSGANFIAGSRATIYGLG